MDIKVNIGLKYKKEKLVTKKDTAAALGSGGVEVFSTPMMVALIENTCLEVIDNELPEGFSTVGIHLNVSHIGATKIGKKVWAEVELLEQDRKKLVFKVEAFDEDKKIGEGLHERFIIDVEKFINKL